MASPLAELIRDGRPRIMGILNVTPDSFSDGNRFLDPALALDHALQMQAEGADIIDVGAESTRPGAPSVSEAQELERLLPVLQALTRRLSLPISVDTSKYEVMRAVLGMGVRVINDVRAMGTDERIPALLAQHGAGIVLTHSRGEPDEMQKNTEYADLGAEVILYLRHARDRALAAGIPAQDIVVDPGIGFGKSAEGNWDLLALLPRLRSELGQEILIGLSRKSFLTRTFGLSVDQIQVPMAAAHLAALNGGARILRVHDIIEAKQVARVFELSLGWGMM